MEEAVTVTSVQETSRAGTRAETVLPFGDRLAERVAARESQLVLGLDPDPSRLWPQAVRGLGSPDAERVSPAVLAARAVAAHCELVLDAVGEHCVAVKLQVACFERLGAPGWSALADTVVLGRERGLLVIADAKRGDVDVTATAYAQAFLGATPTPYGPVEGLGVDAMTVNPLLGRDALAPFAQAARAGGRGLFVLVRTSNPGAADVQEVVLADGNVVSDRLGALVEEIGTAGIGRAGLSDIGAVVGATAPECFRRCASECPAHRSYSRGWAHKGAGSRIWHPLSPAARRAGWCRRPAGSWPPTPTPAATQPARPGARPTGFASWPGAWPAEAPGPRRGRQFSLHPGRSARPVPAMIAGGMAGWRNPARYLAPLALAATVAATYVIVHRAVVANKTSTASSAAGQQLTGLHTRSTRPEAKFYVVQPNDTLSKIAARTGVPVAVLESLNPTINPNALQPSQRLRLRR